MLKQGQRKSMAILLIGKLNVLTQGWWGGGVWASLRNLNSVWFRFLAAFHTLQMCSGVLGFACSFLSFLMRKLSNRFHCAIELIFSFFVSLYHLGSHSLGDLLSCRGKGSSLHYFNQDKYGFKNYKLDYHISPNLLGFHQTNKANISELQIILSSGYIFIQGNIPLIQGLKIEPHMISRRWALLSCKACCSLKKKYISFQENHLSGNQRGKKFLTDSSFQVQMRVTARRSLRFSLSVMVLLLFPCKYWYVIWSRPSKSHSCIQRCSVFNKRVPFLSPVVFSL